MSTISRRLPTSCGICVRVPRGILATCYARPTPEGSLRSTEAAIDLLRGSYMGERFIVVRESPPSTKASLGRIALT